MSLYVPNFLCNIGNVSVFHLPVYVALHVSRMQSNSVGQQMRVKQLQYIRDLRFQLYTVYYRITNWPIRLVVDIAGSSNKNSIYKRKHGRETGTKNLHSILAGSESMSSLGWWPKHVTS